MKMTKKKMGLGMAIIIALGILWSVLKPAPAEAADVDFTIGAERKVEAETNAMYLDSHVKLWGGIGANASLYVNNDFDVNLDHTETVIGFKYKF